MDLGSTNHGHGLKSFPEKQVRDAPKSDGKTMSSCQRLYVLVSPPPATRDTVRVVTNWGYWGCSTSPQASATGQVCTFLLNFPCNNNNYQFISHQLNTLPLTFTTEREIIGLSSYRSKSCLGPGSIKLYHTNFKHFSANMNNFDPFILNLMFVVA